MSSRSAPHLSVLLFFTLWSTSVLAFPSNAVAEGSGDELELLLPVPRSTRGPAPASPPATPPATPTPPPDLTATFIRIKDFLFNRVVDFLRDNLLLILVVMSLLVVMVFIACCASAMSHKRKLEAYYPPKRHPPKRSAGAPGARATPAQPGPQGGCHRAPTKALVGEREGADPRPRPREVHGAGDVEEVEVQREEGAKADRAPVCTCHLKKARQASH